MAGLVYCPLSPQDPEYRLQALVDETKSRLVLIHWMTKDKFNNIITLDIETVIMNICMANDVNLCCLSNIRITSEDIAYVIFTSGSTGIPKAVSIQVYIINVNKFYVGSVTTSKFCGMYELIGESW